MTSSRSLAMRWPIRQSATRWCRARRRLILAPFLAAGFACSAELKPVAPRNDAAGMSSGIDAAAGADAILDTPRIDGFLTADVAIGGGPDATCAVQSAMAERLPLDLYVMMDSSGSMLDPTASGATKWDAVKAAMTAFFNDQQSAGIGVGIQYFPQLRSNVPAECLADGECGNFGPCFRIRTCTGTPTIVACSVNADCARNQTCVLLGACAVTLGACAPAGLPCGTGDLCTAFSGYCLGRDNCDIPPYATPAVAIGALPGAAGPLIASMNARDPDGLTPTSPAIAGAIQYAQQRAQANPNRKLAVVLVTDGFPSECTPTDVPSIAAIAGAGAGGTPAVPTFVIGVFAPEDATLATMNLNALAQGGGTGSAVVISTTQDVTQVLETALNQIRTTAVACEFRIPAATGGAIDFAKVNVQFTGGNGAVTTIGYVRNRAACDATRGGWYYDVDPAAGATPTSIISCDATCTGFRADAAGRVDIVLGCKTFTIL